MILVSQPLHPRFAKRHHLLCESVLICDTCILSKRNDTAVPQRPLTCSRVTVAAAYAGWFLQYKDGINGSGYAQNPCAGPKENATKCSRFWHQLLDEPSCLDGVCDCGAAPCAMYAFDHRNASFSEWFVSEYVMGKLGMGDPNQDGM